MRFLPFLGVAIPATSPPRSPWWTTYPTPQRTESDDVDDDDDDDDHFACGHLPPSSPLRQAPPEEKEEKDRDQEDSAAYERVRRKFTFCPACHGAPDSTADVNQEVRGSLALLDTEPGETPESATATELRALLRSLVAVHLSNVRLHCKCPGDGDGYCGRGRGGDDRDQLDKQLSQALEQWCEVFVSRFSSDEVRRLEGELQRDKRGADMWPGMADGGDGGDEEEERELAEWRSSVISKAQDSLHEAVEVRRSLCSTLGFLGGISSLFRFLGAAEDVGKMKCYVR